MKNLKKGMLLVITLLFVFSVTGCGKVATLKNGEHAVVQFDKEAVSADELYNALKEKYAVETLVDLMDQKIFGKQYETTKEMTETANSEINRWKSLYKDNFSSYLSYSGYASEEDMRNKLILDQKRSKAVEEHVQSSIKDKEIEKYYKNNVYGDVKASHILIAPDTTDDMSDKEKEEAKKNALKEANEVITKLKNGEDFAELAKQYSDDETVDLGWFNDGDMEDSFFKATLDLKKDKYTITPVETSYGYHIILKTGQKEKASLKEVKDTIKEKLAKEKLDKDVALQYNALMEIREKAGMKFEDDELRRKYKAYMTNVIANAKEQAAQQNENK